MQAESVRFDPARLEDFALVVEVGDSLSEDGLTRVRVDGDGRIVVEQEPQREATPRAHAKLDRASTETLLRGASQFDWGRRFPTRPGIPDEAVVQWSLQDRQGAQLTMKTWLREAEKDASMAPVLKALRKTVESSSEGRLYL